MTPQPDSYGGRGPTLNAVLWTETVVATMFVFARCYTRLFILHSAGWDDFFLVLTLLLLAAYSACISAGTAYGIGQKRADIDPADYVQAHMFEIIGQGVCIFNIAISRAAVAFLLLRIVNRGWHKTFIWACIATNSILAVFCTIAVFIQCLPIQAVWNSSVKGNCWLDFAKVGLTTSAYAVCIDFALAIIPCFIVWELKMKKKDKIITIIGLSLGVLYVSLCRSSRNRNGS
ncbi:uncharacterized protein J7T54_006908 [Emericellopsis cladophorae]|uniref:Rhodopsin domain-containing protein n=1 Tax=Emericellopsis cladophorae TaxID=2686198 RepID=A0A9P9Y890_9HYPO|nr:uncharacterized protein J7T54_006908 [Emericellopsis cladophorae]KAI6785266.1 hypothetical protein J7T54_006908 [Emericellopsis cladophorae]